MSDVKRGDWLTKIIRYEQLAEKYRAQKCSSEETYEFDDIHKELAPIDRIGVCLETIAAQAKEIAELKRIYAYEIHTYLDRDDIVTRLRAELETERMRLVGCGVAALMNTEESKANRISRDNPYWSASYQDVCNLEFIFQKFA